MASTQTSSIEPDIWNEMAAVSNLMEEPETIREGMSRLFGLLGHHREELRKGSWRTFCRDVELDPLYKLLREEPVTRRAAEKPRGYPGDAVLIDYLYEEPWARRPGLIPTERGKELYKVLSATPAATAVRNRRRFLAHQIDQTIAKNENARILSVACGHLRELELSNAFRAGKVRHLIALDADPESLDCVDRRMGRAGVVSRQMTTVELLSAKGLGRFDLIYTAGLFDYLTPRIARRVALRLVDLLEKDGRVVISNFLKETTEAGYMEAMMDWQLVYRTVDELRDIVKSDEIEVRTCTDPQSRIGYAELSRCGN